ncbi:MAG: hypothetical protein HY665_08890 [Chloroflexi bacterium]|nr:hypothetical protein [Chloroflexota bacterium]
MKKRLRLHPFLWSSLILVSSQALSFYVSFRLKDFLEQNQIALPEVSFQIGLVYYLGSIALVGLILFLVPASVLKSILKALFILMFAWGLFVVLWLTLPLLPALLISIAAGLVWFFRPRLWLHNLLLIASLASFGSVFGFLFTPWTVILLMLVLSIYDVLAVRFGYMIWMAQRLSESETLPAFIIPKNMATWNLNVKRASIARLMEEEPAEREFAVLGGGDIGFPLLLIASVFFTYGFTQSLIVAAFSLVGLVSAFLIQMTFLKGKPMPALPPIFLASLTGFLIAYFVF